MKKMIAMVILMGFTGFFLQGCFKKEEKVITEPTPAKFSSIAGSYEGEVVAANDCNENRILGTATMRIDPSESTTTRIIYNGLSADGHSLTGSSFKYTLPGVAIEGCGDVARLEGTCQYTSSNLSCTWNVGTRAKGRLELRRG